jgi:hypothetical protein
VALSRFPAAIATSALRSSSARAPFSFGKLRVMRRHAPKCLSKGVRLRRGVPHSPRARARQARAPRGPFSQGRVVLCPHIFGMPPVLTTQILLAMRVAVMFVARAPLCGCTALPAPATFSGALVRRTSGLVRRTALAQQLWRRPTQLLDELELRLGLRHHYDIRAATTSRCELRRASRRLLAHLWKMRGRFL